MEGWIEDRWLAEAYGEKEKEALDYSVLSVAVMTLALILLVEVIRHRLDHEAKHRPFFKVVLETTYSELATLGLVELFVFLLLRYYKLKYKARKEVFAEVHFALFYTAIFNAFQSVICAIATRRVSDTVWVKTEHLELDHYIEIREEFERVQEAYFAVRNDVPKVFRRVWAAIRHPGLRSRYMKLLVQVRFHQLRIHFLENNNLPLTFKVSEYLKRSEETVLMHMVHVNGTAWLLLTGGFNFMYFIIGMVANTTGSPEIVGNWLIAIFFSMLIMFIIICIMLYLKMTRIFETILKLKHCEIDDQVGTQRQRELFWYNEPHLVIALIQFMQFGYAIALSIVIMFWDNLGKVEPYYYLVVITCCYVIFVFVLAKVLPQFTLCTSLGHLVNKEHLNETLALHRLKEAQKRQKRKLVQLTFGEDMDESIICMKMKEEKCKAAGGSLQDCNDDLLRMDSRMSSTAPISSSGSVSENQSRQEQSVLLRKWPSSENMSESESSDSAISRPSTSGFHKGRQSSLAQSALLAELVKMDTSQLRQQLPERTQARLSEREQLVRPRRANRRKSVSDGVQAMAMMGNVFNDTAMDFPTRSGSETMLKPTVAKSKDDTSLDNEDRGTRLANRRANRRKSVSASGIIQAWRQSEDSSKPVKSSPLTTEKPKTVSRHQRKKSASASDIIKVWQDGTPSSEEGPKLGLRHSISQKTTDDPLELHRRLRKERLAQQRQSRRKAVSASAVIQSWQDFSVTDPVPRSASPPMLRIRPSLRDAEIEGTENRTKPHELLPDQHQLTSLDQNALDAWMGTEQQPSQPPSRSVNLSGVHLIRDDADDLPVGKKSVGFSDDLEAPQGDDSEIKKPQADDDSTIDTGKSVGDLSDVGVVPRLDFESLRSSYQWEKPWHVKMRDRLSPAVIRKAFHDMFMSERYPLISHVFGSIVVFFLIGMRVESFNAILGIYEASENTWELRLNASFWWQASWYLLFIVVSALVMWSVHPSANKSFAEKTVFGAAIIDLFLSVSCLTLLFVADTQRCCDDEASYEYGYRRFLYRLLGEESVSHASDTGTKDQEYSDSYGSTYTTDEVYKQCCPFWGYRTFGGLGNIEPFTALIALRVLRFQAATFILRKLKHEKTKDNGSRSSTDQQQSNGNKNHEHHAGEHNDHGNSHNEHGTILEFWQRAINQHPQIVEKYGYFSAELFQTMLGLEVDEHLTSCVAAYEARPSGSVNDLNKVVQESVPEKTEENPNPHYKLNGEQYSCLSAECQGIILAGKLGKPVKSMMNLFEHFSSDGNLPTLHEDSGGEDHDVRTPSIPKSVEFAVDDDRLAEEQNDESVFIAPNARLIRSMRRCDRRLYPLLKQWITVDVVITDYEIVYFEIENDVDEQCLPDEVRTKREALRLALQATKGGKGLRLIDVAAGRKVVGHLDLTDVTQIHVERDMPLLDVSHLEANEVNLDVVNQVPSEYWQKPSQVEIHTESRALRWARVKEDRLKFLSKHGTLMLRFYSDLNDVESRVGTSRADDEDCGHLKKNIALQWAQTVAHICGVDQLKQPLPHFGENSCDELRDYLEIVHQRTEETKGGYRRGRGGNVLVNSPSVQNLNPSEGGVLPAVNQQTPIPKPRLRYSKSFGDVSLDRGTSLRLFRRSVSIGEQDSNPTIDAGGVEAPAGGRRISGDPIHDSSFTQP